MDAKWLTQKELEKCTIYCDQITHEIIEALTDRRFKWEGTSVQEDLSREIEITDPRNDMKYKITVEKI